MQKDHCDGIQTATTSLLCGMICVLLLSTASLNSKPLVKNVVARDRCCEWLLCLSGSIMLVRQRENAATPLTEWVLQVFVCNKRWLFVLISRGGKEDPK
jgi:hypothetical protein